MRRNSIILSDDGRRLTTASRRDNGGVILDQATSCSPLGSTALVRATRAILHRAVSDGSHKRLIGTSEDC